MKRSLLLFALLVALAAPLTAAAAPRDWRDLIASDSSRWTVESYEEGDLNWDDRKDVVAVTSRPSSSSGEDRRLWIFLKQKDGGYKRHTKTAHWPGPPSLHPLAILWTEDAPGGRVFKWQWDPGRNKFYLIEEAVPAEKDVNYLTQKMTRTEPGVMKKVCRVDPKKSNVALDRFDPSKHSGDPSLVESCVDPTLTLDGESAGYYPKD